MTSQRSCGAEQNPKPGPDSEVVVFLPEDEAAPATAGYTEDVSRSLREVLQNPAYQRALARFEECTAASLQSLRRVFKQRMFPSKCNKNTARERRRAVENTTGYEALNATPPDFTPQTASPETFGRRP